MLLSPSKPIINYLLPKTASAGERPIWLAFTFRLFDTEVYAARCSTVAGTKRSLCSKAIERQKGSTVTNITLMVG